MGLRCKGAKTLGVARLSDHRISFFGHSERWDGGEETVVEHPGDDVFGVVYQLSHSDSDRLDSWQGAKLDGTGPYFHSPAEVTGEDGTLYFVLLYKKAELDSFQMPSTEYLDHIVIGAVWHQLPAAYIDKLKCIASKRAGYRVPKTIRTSS